jgi:hypothetical protein
MKRRVLLAWVVASTTVIGAVGCTGGDGEKAGGMPAPERQALTGEPRPALLLTQAWFWTDDKGSPKPGPARLDIWRDGEGGWDKTRLEDPDSNVFHKAIPWDGGILTIGAEGAKLKKWTFEGGQWKDELLWENSWGGRFNRLRDLEIGDVDGDGKDELVIATHDAGVVAVIDVADDGQIHATEMDKRADTFVHEIEIGDIDGDGDLEFFATPSDRNKAGHSQAGGITMYDWDGKKYVRSWVEEQKGTHAKEILAYDVTGDGKSELFGVLEAVLDPNDKKKIVKPVEIRQYTQKSDGTFGYEVIATINDRQTRFLVPGDFDNDGKAELIAPALSTGVYHISPPESGKGPWKIDLIDGNSSGFEHAAHVADLDKDGNLELYVAADDQRELKRYTIENGKFKREVLGQLDPSVLTWNITDGVF